MKSTKTCLMFLILFLMFGCAAKPELPRFVWPAPPDQPKLEFVGNFYSEQDFKKSRGTEILTTFLGSTPEYVMQTPFGIASDGKGKVYISDSHTHSVWLYDFNARTLAAVSKLKLFQSPTGMDVDRAGNLYVADVDKGRVLKLSPQHNLLLTIGREHLKRPAYLTLSPNGQELYVSDAGLNQIVVFDAATGGYLRSLGRLGVAKGEFYSPQGLAFGPDGNLFVVDTLNARIQSIKPDGSYVSSFGERGDRPWQLEWPKDIAFDSDGNLYVVEARSSMVKTFSPEGDLLLVTGAGRASSNPFGFGAPRSIYIDRNDRIYVAESLGKRFSIWQYMSEKYLKGKPYTEQDRQKLLKYMERLANEKK